MIHKHPSVCCLWNYGAKLHLNRRQICNFPCYSTPLISDQRYLTVIQSEQARSHVCVHMYEQALPLCHFQRRDTRAHTCPGSVSEGMSSSTFPLHQSLLPYPLSHQACPVLLQQEICSPVLLLQNCVCVCVWCVCLLVVQSNSYLALTAYSLLDMLERVVLLFALNSEVVVESSTPSIGRQFSQDVLHVLLHEYFFFQL